jgi:hypothetical protein
MPFSFRGRSRRLWGTGGVYPLVTGFEITLANLGVVKMSRLQNVGIALLPESRLAGML